MKRLVGLVGGPDQVARSLSPVIHNAAFAALEMDWEYLPFPVAPGRVGEAVRGLFAAGVMGLNVTMPHKLEAANAVDRLEGAALATGAVNTVEVRSAGLVGHNTDGEGFVRFLEKDLGVSMVGVDVLVIGAGGVARSIVAAAGEAGAGSVTVLARDETRAAELRYLVKEADFRAGGMASAGDFAAKADVLVNATPVGQAGEPPLISVDRVRLEAVVIDLVYSPHSTRLVADARRRGITASGGLGMLLHQGALSFQVWTGQEPPMDAMSAAAIASLKRDVRRAD